MSTRIVEFRSPAGELLRQVATADQADPWFVAKDVCKALGLRNSRKALQALDADEKGVTNCYTPGGQQEVATVSEPGLYRLIMRSRKPEAKAFQRWVTHDVLPEIRRTGSYQATPVSDPRIDQLFKIVEGLAAHVAGLSAIVGSLSLPQRVISAAELAKFKRRLSFVVHRAVKARLHVSPAAARYNFESRIRRAAGWPRNKGAKLELMPESSWAHAIVELSEIEADVERSVGGSQLLMFPKRR